MLCRVGMCKYTHTDTSNKVIQVCSVKLVLTCVLTRVLTCDVAHVCASLNCIISTFFKYVHNGGNSTVKATFLSRRCLFPFDARRLRSGAFIITRMLSP